MKSLFKFLLSLIVLVSVSFFVESCSVTHQVKRTHKGYNYEKLRKRNKRALRINRKQCRDYKEKYGIK